ncbi:MAG: DUF488 domain-containing protein [Planctomycetota bacterium]|jgi:uncharacterized protein YeaO (DUF488 family)
MIRTMHIGGRLPRKGKRFLIARLWPKGANRDELELAAWCKEAAPTHDLLRWYGNKLERWMEFRDEYRQQLEETPQTWQKILDAAEAEDIILLHAARDDDYNAAVVLQEFLEERL